MPKMISTTAVRIMAAVNLSSSLLTTGKYLDLNSSTTARTTTVNMNSSEIAPVITILIEAVCIIALVAGVIGNLLVLIVFGMRWSKLKTCEVFMIGLACADLIGAIVVPCKLLMELMRHSFHPIGNIGCKVISFLSILSLSVSAFTIVVISIDRFIIVKWPLRGRPERWMLFGIILATWILASGIGFIYFIGDRIKLYANNTDNVHSCRNFANDDEILMHTLVSLLFQVVIPLTVMTVLYVMIIYELWHSAKNQLFHRHEREVEIRLKRNKKATMLLIVIVVVFYCCVLPINVFYLLYLFNSHNLSGDATNHVFIFLQMLQMMNSCVNPIIYSNLHTSFRRSTLRMFCSCCFTKFKKYEWGSLGESFKYAITSFRTTRAGSRGSRVSIHSTKDMLVPSRKSFTDEFNQNRQLTNCKRMSEVSQNGSCSPATVSLRTDLSETEQYSLKDLSMPSLRKQFSEGDDDVFRSLTMIANGRQDSSKRSLLKHSNSRRSSESPVLCKIVKFGSVSNSNERIMSPTSPKDSTTELPASKLLNDFTAEIENGDEKRKLLVKQKEIVEETECSAVKL